MTTALPAGVVYTRPWVANTILDLAHLNPDLDIVASGPIIEPACGDGAFLTAITDRLVTSARAHGYGDHQIGDAVRGFDIDADAVALSRETVARTLTAHGFRPAAAHRIAERWIGTGDFLLEAQNLPRAGWVVGNPPYVRVERADPRTMLDYRQRWTTMTGRADVYIGFLEAGLALLADGGRLAYICPDRWMYNTYGRAIRTLIETDFDLETVVSMHDVDAFIQRVNAYPATVVVRRGPHRRTFFAETLPSFEQSSAADLLAASRAPRRGLTGTVSTEAYRFRRPADWPSGRQGWTYPLGPDHDLVRRLSRDHPTLAEAGVTVRVGAATGADEVFIVDRDNGIEADRLEPVVGASETVGGTIQWLGRSIVNPWTPDGLADLTQYPGMARHFENNRRRLRNRRTARDNPDRWWRTIDRIDPRTASTPKLLVPDVKDVVDPVLDTGRFQPMHNLYYLLAPGWDLEVLGGLLLSEPVAAFIRAHSVRMANGYLRVSAQYLRRIHIPRSEAIRPETARRLAAAFQTRDRRQATAAAFDAYDLPARLLPTGTHLRPVRA